jgi:hypothetical protein
MFISLIFMAAFSKSDYYQMGKKELENKNYSEAISYFEKADQEEFEGLDKKSYIDKIKKEAEDYYQEELKKAKQNLDLPTILAINRNYKQIFHQELIKEDELKQTINLIKKEIEKFIKQKKYQEAEEKLDALSYIENEKVYINKIHEKLKDLKEKEGIKTEVSEEKKSEPEKPKVIGKPNQLEFHQKLIELEKKYNEADTEMKKSKVYREMASWLRKYIPNAKVMNWEGKLVKIGTNEGGTKAYIEIESNFEGKEIIFKTWNNEISDLFYNTMIPLNSKVYRQLEDLKKGDYVIFDAIFIPASKGGFEQANMLEYTKVADPEFIVRFTNIRKKE